MSVAPQAFSKVVHLEPDNGEAWNNLAALWLKQQGWREALHAAEQAVKCNRESWQTWDNYATAATRAGVLPAAVRALSKVRGGEAALTDPCWPPLLCVGRAE
jgi:tetratricopeptide (TPR) repeat protein